MSAGRSRAEGSLAAVGTSSDGRPPPGGCGASSAITASSYPRKEATSAWGIAAEAPSEAPTWLGLGLGLGLG